MFNQRCEFFIVKRRAEKLAYELNLSTHWRVYSVISVTQLKSCSNEENSYRRFRSNYSNFVKIEDDTDDWRFYIVKKIIDKKLKKFERITVTQYMIKWLEYESKYNEWRFLFYLNNCLKLMKKYEQRIAVKKNQLSKSVATSLVAAVSVKQKFIATQSVVVVITSIKRERKRSRKNRWWKMMKDIHKQRFIAWIWLSCM